MSLQGSVVPAAPFSIGRVLKDSFRVLARNFIPFILVAFVLDFGWAMVYRPDITDAYAGEWSWSSLVIGPFGNAIVADLVQLILVFAVLRTLRGQRPGIGDFTLGFRSIPAVAGASIISALPTFGSELSQVALGSKGFAVAAVMIVFGILNLLVMLMLWVVVPSIAAERRGLRDGLARSLELTKGRRWKLLGLSLVAGVMILPFVFGIHFVFGVPLAFLASLDPMTLPGAALLAVMALVSAFFAVLVAVSYHHLRIDKDGVDVERVVQVFD